MAAKDYTLAAGWKDIYLTKKTKTRKDGLHVMSTDRRPLDEQEILYVIENYLRMYCANNDTDEVTVTNDGKPVFMYYDRNGYNTRNKYVFIEKGGEL